MFNGKDMIKTVMSMIAFKTDMETNPKIAGFIDELDGYSIMYGFLRGCGQSHEFAVKLLDDSPLGKG